MSGSIEGGKKAAATNKAKYGKDWYRQIGAMGGRNGHTGGFAANPNLARTVGRIGGLKSKRGVKMSDALYQAKNRMYYCRSRLRYYEEKMQTCVYDLDIRDAEKNAEYWKAQLATAEKKVEKESEKCYVNTK